MYSPKIKNDLIKIIYMKAKLNDTSMTEVVDSILRPSLIENDTKVYKCFSCKKPVDVVEEGKAYCDNCESIVFVEKS